MSERLTFDVGSFTQQGQHRYQEDAVGHEVGPSVAVFAVADGLGRHPHGDLASKAAVEAAVGLALLPTDLEGESAPRLGALAFNLATAAHRSALDTGGRTTLALALVTGARAAVAHVGDSRVYRLRGGMVAQLTEDHRVARRYLSRWLGGRREDPDFSTPTVSELDTHPGDVWVLATDGVSDTLSEKWIQQILEREPTAQAAAEALVRFALKLGSGDNCTALVVRVGGAS
ncbi:PP2C family serine/threonine-protein phosphatase [Myxococcus sp. CA039A]|uniref:PP2C family protein-serine/threonine phosphatase n=1 Tax=Myxococcus sp. CA039A TaxID=2741737 RepID=UPI00157B841B|nr:PP2C family serine/threonine-protein phosphatase [Myxococcus sp. CA039A]NTX54820.1 serine/threonine-protein phosphatase [Myxococcus sp. CA039A]